MIIGIDKGHRNGTGASRILNETTENRKIGDRLITLLREKGHTVVDCTSEHSNSDSQLAEIKNKANAQRLDLFVSIHLNAGGGHGTETYVYNGSYSGKESNRAIAKRINDEVAGSCGFRNRGLKEANFYVLRSTVAPALLVEVCFVDSSEDAGKLNVENVARAMFKGITGTAYVPPVVVPADFDDIQYLLNHADVLEAVNGASSYTARIHYTEHGKAEGRSYKKPAPHICSPSTPPASGGQTMFRVVCGTYGERANAEAQQERLKSAGFDSFLITYEK